MVSVTLAWVESQLNWNYKGYTFVGWARTKTATTAEFSNGQRVQDLAESGKTLTLYAVEKQSMTSLPSGATQRPGRQLFLVEV